MPKQTNVSLLENGDILAYGKTWRFDPAFPPALLLANGSRVDFSTCEQVESVPFVNGLGAGARTLYRGIPGCDDFMFETCVQIDDTDGHADFTFSVRRESTARIKEALYPSPLMAGEEGSYAVLNTMQGQLLPDDWPEEIGAKLPFDGQMCSESAYMP